MPSTSSRGYGHSHRALRAKWVPIVATGEVVCPRCYRRIKAGQVWDLGHADGDRSRYSGPEHATCNRGKRRDLEPHPSLKR
jgi:hypothetical protein